MSVEYLEVIDIISIDLNGNAVLTISDELKWENINEHLFILQNKINAYLNAIESGTLYESYPNARDRQICINLISKYEPNDEAIEFLNKTKVILETVGYLFTFKVLNV